MKRSKMNRQTCAEMNELNPSAETRGAEMICVEMNELNPSAMPRGAEMLETKLNTNAGSK